MKKRVIMQLILVLFSFWSCTSLVEIEDKTEVGKEENNTEEAVLSFSVRERLTKSSITADENSIDNINIYVFRGGNLMAYKYVEGSSPISLTLPRGYIYNIYALGNFGVYEGAADEASFIENCNKTISNIAELNSSLPMSWSKTGLELSSTHTSISINFERLVAKLGFSLDKSSVSGLKVTSIRLKQSPRQVFPFRWEGGSRVIDSAWTLDGDYASASDLVSINNGGSIYFYTFENCQGTLLPDNTDPWEKSPDNMSDIYLSCTYLEVEGEFTPDSPFVGGVKYRLFLGEDNCSNFDVRRNTDINISLKLTNSGLGEDSWKIDTNLSFRDGYTLGWIDESNRELYDQYIGNSFWYMVEVNDDIVEYLGGSLEGCYYLLTSNNGAAVRIDNYSYDTYNTMSARLTCTQAGAGTLWLYSPKGKPIQNLTTDITIYTPSLLASFSSFVSPYNNSFGIDSVPQCFVNGGQSKVYIYLVDSHGYNLNTGYEYDLSLFDFSNPPFVASDFGIQETLNITMSEGAEASNGPAVIYSIRCTNSGTNAEMNNNLANAFRDIQAFSFEVEEVNYNLNQTIHNTIDINPVKLVIVDNGWAEYFSSQLSLKVLNPSNLPLNIDVWEANTSKKGTHTSVSNDLKNLVENFLTVKRRNFITNTFYNGASAMYSSYSPIRSERNHTGSEYLIDGSYLVHPLRNINTDDICSALLYDYLKQVSLHHLFDVRVRHKKLEPSDINVVDSLSNGSNTYDIIYGNKPYNPGWNNQGMWLWSKDNFISKSNNLLDIYPNLTALNLSRFRARFDVQGIYELKVEYDHIPGILYASSDNGNIYNVSLDFRYSGTVQGYVKTYPRGRAFAGKDNYCSAIINKTVTGVNVGMSFANIDNGALKAGMNAVYAQTFFDSHNWIGSANNYQHHAHPISIDLKMEVKLSNGTEWYPIEITFLDTTLPFYHFQETVTYNPTFNPSVSTFKFAQIQRK